MSNDKNTKEIVTKSNELIHSCYSFSLLEQQLLLFIVSTVDPFTENMDFDYKIYVKDFLKKFPKKNKNIYADIENAVMNKFWERDLMYWSYNKQDYGKFRWFSHVYYSKTEGYFLIEFSRAVKPMLYQLKSNFTSYYIDNINSFKSIFSIRVYEICVCNINRENKANFVCIVTLKDLREWLELEDKYERDRDFKRRVLQKAKEEINAHSDLIIDFEEIKKGRKVDSIKFIVQRKEGCERATYANDKNKISCDDFKKSNRGMLNHQGGTTTETDACHDKIAIDTGSRKELMLHNSNQDSVMTKGRTLPQGDEINLNRDNANNLTEVNETNKPEHTQSQKLAIQAVLKFGLSQANVVKFIEEYGESIVMQVVSKVQKAIDSGKYIKNTAGYFVKTLKDSGGELVHDSEQYKDIQEAEQIAKSKQAIAEELLKFEIAESLKK